MTRSEISRTRNISLIAIVLGLAVLVGVARGAGEVPVVRWVLAIVAVVGIVLSLVHVLSLRGPSKVILFHQGEQMIVATNHLHQGNRLRFFRDVLGEHSFAFSDEDRERWNSITKEGFHPVFNVRGVRKTYLLPLCFMTFDEVYVLDHLGRWDFFDCKNTSEPTSSSRGVSPFRDDSVLPETRKQPAAG